MIPTLFLVTLIVFLSVRFIPGSVIDLMISEQALESGFTDVAAARILIEESLGMDVSAPVQYWRWLVGQDVDGAWQWGVFGGNLGSSLWTLRPVTETIFARLPTSLELGFLAIFTGLLIAIPIGTYSAIRQDTAGDYIGRTFAILIISVPSFWLGTMTFVYPSIWWGWSPPIELISFGEDPLGNIGQFLLPAIILGMVISGTTMRMTRTMMLEVLRQDYIRTAWSKGLRERTIIMRHALKNALIPVVTLVGLQLTIVIGGTVVLEMIFALPGIGRLLIDALTTRDYPIISGINLVLATFIIVGNLLVDLTYAFLDPRIHYK